MRLFFAFLLFCHVAVPAIAADWKRVVENSLTGRTPSLANYFGEAVEVTIGGEAEIYSGPQANAVFQRFLSQGANWRYTVIHQGQWSNNDLHSIGTLAGSLGSFRVSLSGRTTSGTFSIFELSVERE